jgi:integrase
VSTRQKLVPYVHTDGKIWDHFFVDAKSKVIYFEKRHNGKRIKFSTKIKYPDGIKAKRYANTEFDKRTGKTKNYVHNLIGEELDLFEKMKDAENLSYFTERSYKRGIKDIRPFWAEKLPSEINGDNLTKWYEWWAKNKDIEIENAVKWMRNFCKYLSQKTLNGMPLLPAVPRIVDPNRKNTLIVRAKKKERIISPEEFKIIYDKAENEVHQLIVLFMYTMGTRIDETLKLDFKRTVLLDEPIPLYRWFPGQNKADLTGQHMLHKSLIGPLRKLREVRRREGTDLLFPQKKNIHAALSEQQIEWEFWRERAELGWHWTPHTFRHTCLTNILNDPRSPQIIACKQYRVSPQVAMKTYVKTKEETMLILSDIIEVKL